jgi:light-regulated signal transduction histidine kinase (bacteriophytochrome)
MEIADRMSIGPEERALRLAFLELTPDDAARLRELHPFAERHVAEIVDAFYEHLLKFETTRAILGDVETIQRLKEKQRQYFLSLTGIADQGPGIPTEYHQLIFERFRHFDRGTPAHSDTGLGLPFCKMAVEHMGGAIWVESNTGQGAIFYFTLPASV